MSKSDQLLKNIFLPLLPSWMTPNQLTIARLVLTPFVIWLLLNESYLYGGLLFTFAMFTDALDGALARTKNMITSFGKVADPLADKILMIPTGLIMIVKFSNPMLIYIIIATEVILVIGGMHRKLIRKKEVEAEIVGKIKVILQSLGLGFLIIYAIGEIDGVLVFAETLLYVSVALGLFSLFSQKGI